MEETSKELRTSLIYFEKAPKIRSLQEALTLAVLPQSPTYH